MHDGATAVAAAHRHQTLGLEDSQRFPQRYQADAELLDEHLLAWQQVTVGKFAVDDLPAEFVGDDLGRPARAAAGGEPRGQFPVLSYRTTMLTVTGPPPGVYGSLSDKSY